MTYQRFLRAGVAAALLFLAACATHHNPVPDGYTGPVATLIDTGTTEDGSRARIFYVESIDDIRIDNARSATRRSSYGTGMSLHMRTHERQIPVRAMKLKLIGSHVVAAPIHEIASRAAGTFFEVEGVIEFTPQPGATYLVRGDLKKQGSSVWLEQVGVDGPVTPKIVGQ
jgi:hypothetical protein